MKILFFAQLRDAAGVSEAVLEDADMNAGQLWDALISRWPGLGPLRRNVRLARNGEYAAADEIFRAGDEVALIPPVSGG